VTAIRGLDQIVEADGWIVIGAAVTHTAIEANPLIRHHGAALAESCSVVGGPQVRNVATIGGNVAHALPAADGTIGLLALDAEVQICSPGMALRPRFRGNRCFRSLPGRARIASPPTRCLARFASRCGRRTAAAPSTASCVHRVWRCPFWASPRRCGWMQQASAPLLPRLPSGRPARSPSAPRRVRRSCWPHHCSTTPCIEAAVAAAQRQAELRTSKHRASKEYRHEMIAVLLRRVLPTRNCARAQAG
jgi:hypothetical protein